MNILLLYGGKSCEHDISVITACLAKGYFTGKIYGAYFTQENVCYLVPDGTTPKQHKTETFKYQLTFLSGKKQIAVLHKNKIKRILDIDVAVNCCHGHCGEDGSVAGLCALGNIPLVGSDVISSAVTMDKVFTKQTLNALNLPNVQGFGLQSGFAEGDLEKVEEMGYPVIVKPATLGSSIGITMCHDRAELQKGLETAFTYDSRVLCEKALTDFYELNCAAIMTPDGVETSRVERPYTTHDILTFQDKYQQNLKFAPAQSEIPQELENEVRKMTEEIYIRFGLGGVVRVDFLVDSDGKLYVNEVNTTPGSLAYGLWQHKYTPAQYGEVLINGALANFQKQEALNRKFNSGVLDSSLYSKK